MAAAPTQPAQAPKGADYGEAQATLDRQMVQPVAGAPAASSGNSPTPQSPIPGMGPGEVPSLLDPTARPNEPLTAGLSTGPGAGPEALSMGAFGPAELSLLRGMYKKFRFEPLRQMIEQIEQNL